MHYTLFPILHSFSPSFFLHSFPYFLLLFPSFHLFSLVMRFFFICPKTVKTLIKTSMACRTGAVSWFDSRYFLFCCFILSVCFLLQFCKIFKVQSSAKYMLKYEGKKNMKTLLKTSSINFHQLYS